jgi:hypothetical protein
MILKDPQPVQRWLDFIYPNVGMFKILTSFLKHMIFKLPKDQI